MKPVLREIHYKIMSELSLSELVTSDLILTVHANRTRVFAALKELTRLNLLQARTGQHNQKTWGLTRKGRRFAESLPSELAQNVQFTSLAFDLGSPSKAKLTVRLPSYLGVAARQRLLNRIASPLQSLGTALTYAYVAVATGDHESTSLNASISLNMESPFVDRAVVEFRKTLEMIVDQSETRFLEWQSEYESLFTKSEDRGKLVSCKRVLHRYFACENVFFEQELEKLGVITHLTGYASVKCPLLPPTQPFKIPLSPSVETITSPETIRFGKFQIDNNQVDLVDSVTFAKFLNTIRAEPLYSWIRRNREHDGLNSWFFPIPWTEMEIPCRGDKYLKFFEDPLALEGRYQGLFYVRKQEPRVNWDIRYALHKITRSSIEEGVEHWFVYLQKEMRQDERIRAWHEIDDRSIIETYTHVKKELQSDELPTDLADLPRELDPSRAPHLRIIYDPLIAGVAPAIEDLQVSKESTIKKFLGIIEHVRRSRGPKVGSYRIAEAMLEVREQYESLKSGGWNPTRALDQAVSHIIKRHEWSSYRT